MGTTAHRCSSSALPIVFGTPACPRLIPRACPGNKANMPVIATSVLLRHSGRQLETQESSQQQSGQCSGMYNDEDEDGRPISYESLLSQMTQQEIAANRLVQ